MNHPDRLRSARALLQSLLMATALVAPTLLCAQAETDRDIAITKPASGATVHDNQGNVAVEVAVKGSGAIVVLLDEKPYGPPRNETSFTLEAVDRGEHTLRVQLVDQGGRVLASSQPVRFFLWRASALFPGRKN